MGESAVRHPAVYRRTGEENSAGGRAYSGYEDVAALDAPGAFLVMLAYTFQIFLDFSAYSDMAMGLAGMMGISLPVNFRSPYKARSVREFWKRWHITLNVFFTKYVYIPLGGNRTQRG